MRRAYSVLAAGLLALGSLPAGGCGVSGSATLRSATTGDTLRPKIRVLAYRSDDPQAADIYLTDLAPADLEPGVDPRKLTGNLIHIHQFLMPKAGRTPIASAASSVTVRYVVLSGGAIGVYGGGGFLMPKGKPGDDIFGGSMSEGTLKLIEGNGQFHDPLGACDLSVTFRAPRDEATARLMAARLEDIVNLARER